MRSVATTLSSGRQSVIGIRHVAPTGPALALLSALTGCVGSPPNGPLVEYRAGLTPITRPVRCEANYVLVAKDSAAAPLAAHHVVKGERIGFRREADGSVVAVAPGYALLLAQGEYAWEVVPNSVPPWRERLRYTTRERVVAAARATGAALVATSIVALCVTMW